MPKIQTNSLPVRAIDANAEPVAGALLYVYLAGTSTPVTTYQDVDLATPHASPVVANGAGTFAPIYVAPGSHKIDIQDPDTLASLPGYPEDNVTTATAQYGANERTAANLAGLYAIMSDGDDALIAGLWYTKDSTKTGSNSITNDLSENGWVPKKPFASPGHLGWTSATTNATSIIHLLRDFVHDNYDSTNGYYPWHPHGQYQMVTTTDDDSDTGVNWTGKTNPGLTFFGWVALADGTSITSAYDFSGSKGFNFDYFKLIGSANNPPLHGALFSRMSPDFSAASNHFGSGLECRGEFQRAALILFASEVSNIRNNTIQNKYKGKKATTVMAIGANAVYNDIFGAELTSDFVTVPAVSDGQKSNIIHDFGTMRIKRPHNFISNIVSLTPGATTSVTLTTGDAALYGLANGNELFSEDIVGSHADWTDPTLGMDQRVFQIANLSGDTFDINIEEYNVVSGEYEFNAYDTSAHNGTFTSGRFKNRTGYPLVVSGAHGLRWFGYAVSYGRPSVLFDLKNDGNLRSIKIGGQGERGPSPTVRFLAPATGNGIVKHLDMDLLQTAQESYDCVIDNEGLGNIKFESGSITLTGTTTDPVRKMFGNPGNILAYNLHVDVPKVALLNDYSDFSVFEGSMTAHDRASERTIWYNQKYGEQLYVEALTNADASTINFGDPDDDNIGKWAYDHNIEAFRGYTNTAETVRFYETDMRPATDDAYKLGTPTRVWSEIHATEYNVGASGPVLISGSGSPETAVTAIVGSIFMRTDGGASTSIYVKESGTGNTGWVAK